MNIRNEFRFFHTLTNKHVTQPFKPSNFYCLCSRQSVLSTPLALYEPRREKIGFFVYATRIVPSLYFLNTKFPVSTAQSGLCRTWSETPKTGFLTTRFILSLGYPLYRKSYFCMRTTIMETTPYKRYPRFAPNI